MMLSKVEAQWKPPTEQRHTVITMITATAEDQNVVSQQRLSTTCVLFSVDAVEITALPETTEEF